MHIRHFLISCLTSIAMATVSVVSAVLYLPMLATEAVASIRWDWPADARTSLIADFISRRVIAILEPVRSSFRAFYERALCHDLFTSGRFDPGRMPA